MCTGFVAHVQSAAMCLEVMDQYRLPYSAGITPEPSIPVRAARSRLAISAHGLIDCLIDWSIVGLRKHRVNLCARSEFVCQDHVVEWIEHNGQAESVASRSRSSSRYAASEQDDETKGDYDENVRTPCFQLIHWHPHVPMVRM